MLNNINKIQKEEILEDKQPTFSNKQRAQKETGDVNM